MKLFKIPILLFVWVLPFTLLAQSQDIFAIQDYGAQGDGATVNTQAIQAAINAAHEAGGGRVLISGGTFVSGTLILKSGVEIHVTAGDTLLGSPYLRDYPDMEQRTIRSYTERYSRKAFIYAESATDIALTGRGMIHGNSYAPEFKAAEHDRDKPLGMRLISCKRVKVEAGYTRQDS